jgi:hypothetical protein
LPGFASNIAQIANLSMTGPPPSAMQPPHQGFVPYRIF